jgi:leucyl aminopeptidase
MHFKFTTTSPNASLNALHVFMSFDKQYIQDVMSNVNLNDYNVGTKIALDTGKLVFLDLDKTKLFLSVKNLAEKISGYNEPHICLYMASIENKYKLIIIQLIAKFCYRFTKYKTNSMPEKTIYIKDRESNRKVIENIVQQVRIANINRDFQNEPSNVIYPETFVKYALKMLPQSKHLKKIVLNEQDLKKQGYNLLVNMGAASNKKPMLLILHYTPNPKYKTIALVGKGVCFDTGGVNLKSSSPKFYQMKSDKTGATTVVSLLKYIMESKIPVNIIVVAPLIENAISGSGLKPGDIVKSFSGKSVEILDTDAEGRIILADAFGYLGSINKKIDYLIDIATLTGDSEHFHCDTSAAVFTSCSDLKQKIEHLSEIVGERIYTLPNWPEYVEYTKSAVADVKNLYFDDCQKSGTFMATMFLSNFVPEKLRDKWVHLDVTHSYTGHLSNGNCTILLMNLIHSLVKS